MKNILDDFYKDENVPDTFKSKVLFDLPSNSILSLSILSSDKKRIALVYINVSLF